MKKDNQKRHPWWSIRLSLVFFFIALMAASAAVTAVICLLLYKFIPGISGHTQIWYFIIALLFALFLGVILAATTSKLWLKTADDLSDAVNQVSRGNYKVKVDDKRHKGEFGDLIRAFNNMTEELSHVELFRNDFINYFSHEFKTPIVSIRGFARQLQKEGLTDEERREYTQIIIDECDRLARLSTNILLLSRFENQQIVTSVSTFSIDEQIRHTLVLLEKEWSRKGLQLDLELDEVTYTTNEEMLSLVWTNLLSNAIKYSHEGGRIEIVCDEDAEHVHVVVSDEGIGISEEDQKHIFDKFFQADPSHKGSGNGLGLALVRRIVELCGGTVRVSSRPGQGASFSVTLPKELPR